MKVISWNILADEFIEEKYYQLIPIKFLDRNKRLKIIINRIKQENPDVLLLQEVMIKEYNILKKLFKNFYISNLNTINWKYLNEYGNKSESGNIILLRKTKFSNFEYILDEFCMVSCIYKNEKICFINIHLDDLSSITRYKQIYKIIHKTNKFNNIIIAGDFNEKYNKKSNMYKLFKKYGYKSSIINNDPTYFISKTQSIDNIFYRNFDLKSSFVSNDCGKRTIENIICQMVDYGSDHFPIISYFS